MTAAASQTVKPAVPDELAKVIARLRSAACDLEDAASEAADAADDVRAAWEKDETPGAPTADLLVAAVVRMHDDEHAGPLRWCAVEVCRIAWVAS